jgi:hypothetical protein
MRSRTVNRRFTWSGLARPYNIFEPDQVEMCRQAFSNLLSASATGLGAEAIIEQALSSLG